MGISKSKNGTLYKEDFSSSSLLWTITPYDNTRFSYNNGLILKHGEGKVLATLPSPTEYKEYVVQVEIEHNPILEGDIGAFCVLSTTDDFIECQTYVSNNNEVYKYIKAICSNNSYTFYVSEDSNNWKEIGNAALTESNRLGFVLYGDLSIDSSDYIIKEMLITSSQFAEINGVEEGDVRITDRYGVGINNIPYSFNADRLVLDLTQVMLPLECNITVTDTSGQTILEANNMSILGGDVYEINDSIKFEIDNVEFVNSDQIYSFGEIEEEVTYKLIKISNTYGNAMQDKKVKVYAYSPYSTGQEKVFIAINDNSKEYSELVYSKELTIASLNENEAAEIVVKIDKKVNSLPLIDKEFKFKISVE